MRSTEWLQKVENFQEKSRNPASATLTCPSRTFFQGVFHVFFSGKLFHKIALTTCKGFYIFGEPNACYFDRAPQGQLPKQKHSPKIVPGKSCSEKVPNFHGIEPLITSYLS